MKKLTKSPICLNLQVLIICISLTIFFASCVPPIRLRTESKIKNVNTIIVPKTQITFDQVAFEKDDKLYIYDAQKNKIAYYQRYENPNFTVQACKLFNLDDKVIYLIVPSIEQGVIKLNFKNEKDQKGYISVRVDVKTDNLSPIIKYYTDVKMFDWPLELEINFQSNLSSGFMNMTGNSIDEHIFYYNKKAIFGANGEVNYKNGINNSKAEIIVNEDFLKDNKEIVSCLLLSVLLYKETLAEINYNNDRHYRRTKTTMPAYNTDHNWDD